MEFSRIPLVRVNTTSVYVDRAARTSPLDSGYLLANQLWCARSYVQNVCGVSTPSLTRLLWGTHGHVTVGRRAWPLVRGTIKKSCGSYQSLQLPVAASRRLAYRASSPVSFPRWSPTCSNEQTPKANPEEPPGGLSRKLRPGKTTGKSSFLTWAATLGGCTETC